MSTITTIQGSDLPSDSREVINTNFSNLNTDKAELASPTFTGTPTLPTGTVAVTQSADDNSTAVATTAYADAAAAAVTTTTALTSIPVPNWHIGTETSSGVENLGMASNTTARLTQVVVPFKITVNTVSVQAQAATTPGTLNIALYSEDGQTQLFEVTTATISGAGTITTAVSSVEIPPGIYYSVVSPNASANITVWGWFANTSPFFESQLLGNVTSKPVLNGEITITADTLPATFSPTTITADALGASALRLDN